MSPPASILMAQATAGCGIEKSIEADFGERLGVDFHSDSIQIGRSVNR
jgi:hypothetical protein